MAYNFSEFKQKAKDVEEWLRKELSTVRAGRANPSILDGVMVESYGAMTSINQLANIVGEDARSIRITPWDMSQAKSIEKAIFVANLGLSIMIDDKGVRVLFPELTSERRVALIKVAKQKHEDAKVTLRMEREKIWEEIQKKEKEGGVSEDEKFRLKNEMQKIVDETTKKLEETIEKKEKEITA